MSVVSCFFVCFFFSSRRRHTRFKCDWSSDVCSSDLVPQEYGGSGLGILDTVLVLEEIGKVCYVTAMAALGELGVQTRVISTYAPEPIKRRILPRGATGEAILAICMTEPDAGTDVPNYTTNTPVKGGP